MDSSTLEDWMHLLGTEDVLPAAFSGRTSPADARDALLAARDNYPQVSQDYIAVIDFAASLLNEIERMVEDQDDSIDAWNSEAEAVGLRFEHERGKLLDEDGRLRFNDFLEQVKARIDARNKEKKRLEREMEKLQEESRSLADEIEIDLDIAQQEVAEAAADVAAALADYEDELDNARAERVSTWSGSIDVNVSDDPPFDDDPNSGDWLVD